MLKLLLTLTYLFYLSTFGFCGTITLGSGIGTSNVGVFADIQVSATADNPPSGITSDNLARDDIFDNSISLDAIFTCGDNIGVPSRDSASMTTFMSDFTSRGIIFRVVEGNHDTEIYGSSEFSLDCMGPDYNCDNGYTAWQYGDAWWTDYPYAETTLASTLSIGDVHAHLTSATGFSGSEPWVFFWNESAQTGELKLVTGLDGTTISFNHAMHQSFATGATQVMQGRDKTHIYNLLQAIFGEGDTANLGENALSNYWIKSNNVFVTLGMETYYDNPSFPTPTSRTGPQDYISTAALTWLGNLLTAYPTYNFFVFSHAVITGAGLYDPSANFTALYYPEGNQAGIQALLQAHPNQVALWFNGHAHWLPLKSGAVTYIKPSSGWGGATFVGVPALARYGDLDSYSAYKIWWNYLTLTGRSSTAVLRLRNSTTEAWEDFDKNITLPYTVLNINVNLGSGGTITLQ